MSYLKNHLNKFIVGAYCVRPKPRHLKIFQKINTYFILALVSLTAAINNKTVNGILAIKIIVVFVLPKSGLPEVNSKAEPTPAIAVIQHINKNKQLIGVTKNNMNNI